MIAQALGLVLTTVTGAMVTGAIAGAMASTVDQLIAMGYHSQASFKLKDVAINAMMTGITGGLNKLAQGGEAFAVASLGVKAGALAHGVVTAEAIALAQQAALVATHLQKHMDWHAVSSAVFNAVMDDTAKNLIGGEGDFAKLARSGMTRFADALGAAAIYKQKMTFSGMTAQVLGGMTGSVMGSQMMDAEVRKHEAAMRVERGIDVGFAGGGRSVAQLGMSVDEDQYTDRPTPKPSYTKVDMDRDIAEAKTEHKARSLAEVLRASRMDRWREDVGAIESQVGQFFSENGPMISKALSSFSLMKELSTFSNGGKEKDPASTKEIQRSALPGSKFDYWQSVNNGFWGTIGTINGVGDAVFYPLHHPLNTLNGIKDLAILGADATLVLIGADPGGTSKQNLINMKNGVVEGVHQFKEDLLSDDPYRSHYALGTALGFVSMTILGGEAGAVGRFSRTNRFFRGGEGVANFGANSAADALRLKTTLHLQEAGLLDESGRLTQAAIRNAEPALKPGTVLNNQSVVEALTRDGSQITDWNKLTTQSVELSNGQRVQIHFYRNRVTGEVNYTHPDFKIKGVVNQFYTPKPLTDNSKYIPLTVQDILENYRPKY